MRNNLLAYFDTNPNKEYKVIQGATYTETFNEEINSMVIVLDGVKAEDRLYLDRPYHFIKVVNNFEVALNELLDNDTPCLVYVEENEEYEVGDNYFVQGAINNPEETFNFLPSVGSTFKLITRKNRKQYIYDATITAILPAPSISGPISYYFDVTSKKEIEYDEGLLFKDKNSIIMLLDNFVETSNNIGDEKFYKYELHLMNCVKLLEKIQCPNLVITHNLDGSTKTIWYYIDQYMRLYSPKIKKSINGETWSYEYLLNWTSLNVPLFNKTVAADMQMNEPTLREVITNLMLQVGCIPTSDYLSIKFINFRENPETVTVEDTDGINFISHSGASDSYANSLIQSPTQILDNENEVIADLVGFRDSANALIKQTENLQLETRQPIYTINRVLMRAIDTQQDLYIVPMNENNDSSHMFYPILAGAESDGTSSGLEPSITIADDGEPEIRVNIKLNFVYNGSGFHRGKLSNVKVHLCKYVSNEYVYVRELNKDGVEWILEPEEGQQDTYTLNDDGTITLNSSTTGSMSIYQLTLGFMISRALIDDGHQLDFKLYATHIWFENLFTDLTDNKEYKQFVPLSYISGQDLNYIINCKQRFERDNTQLSFNVLYPTGYISMQKFNISPDYTSAADITQLVVENGKRRLLDTNFSYMENNILPDLNKTLDDLSKYIYGTMGYSIGDNKITGMSNTYSRAQMWWSLERTYFDTILNFIYARAGSILKFDFESFARNYSADIENYLRKYCYYETYPNDLLDFEEGMTHVNNPIIGNWSDPAYSKMNFLFYIYYRPLNNFKFKLSKDNKDIPFDIEQYNQSGDGLSDYNRLIANIQDMTNRIGNPVKSLPQTIDDTSKIKPLNGIYNDGYYDFTIFNRQFAIYENYITCIYYASENYVIQNYFTSIITKYRAYQYVDYNQAVVRKENLKVYAMISDKHYYDGDDHIILYNKQYTLNDIANVLGVSLEDVNDYINYSIYGTPTKSIQCMDRFGIGFDLAMNLIGPILREGMDIRYYREYMYSITSDLASIVTEYANVNATSYYTWQSSSDFNNNPRVGPFISEEMLKESSNLREFVEETFYPNSNYINASEYNTLKKMDGGILKIGEDYYRIYIFNDDAEINVCDSNFEVNEYNTIKKLIDNINVNIIESQYNLSYKYIYYNDNAKVKRLFTYLKNVYICLDKLTEKDVTKDNIDKVVLLSGLVKHNQDKSFKYVIKSSYNESNIYEEAKNECSMLVNNRGFSVHYQDYDNVSAGPYLTQLGVDSSVGGYLQKWQIWNQNNYNIAHSICFCYGMKLFNDLSQSDINASVAKLPIVTDNWIYRPYTLMQIVDNNKSQNLLYTFNKDNAEIINQTIQFEFYADKNDIIFSKNLILNNILISKLELDDRSIAKFRLFNITGKRFILEEGIYSINSNPLLEADSFVNYDSSINMAYIEIPWEELDEDIEAVKITYCSHESGNSYNGCQDFIAFKRNGRTTNTKYYVSLNDTKTNDVYYFQDREDLFETYECDNGSVRTCHLKNN